MTLDESMVNMPTQMQSEMKGNLEKAHAHCRENGLLICKKHAEELLQRFPRIVHSDLHSFYDNIERELSCHLFFSIPAPRQEIFDNLRAGWEDIIDTFPVAISDIEEMRKCFALSRYPACVFHSLQVIEHGVIELGNVLRVKDHKPGWVATTQELKRILKKRYDERTDWEKRHFGFVEQIHATVEALMTAWRHKIDHASGRLAVLPGEFNPDTAEDIMSATRAFMRRLSTERPIEVRPETDVP